MESLRVKMGAGVDVGRVGHCFRPTLLLLPVLLGIPGCAAIAVAPEPFAAFSSAAKQLRDGADASLNSVQELMRDRHIAEASSEDPAKLEALLLGQPDGDPFGWVSSNPPLFLRTAEFRDAVHRLNSVLVTYADFLEQLAAPDLIARKTFDQLAADLNSNLKRAMQALNASSPAYNEVGMISTGASTAFRAYLQNKRRADLHRALLENQANIDAVAERGASAVRLTARALRSEYDVASKDFALRKAAKKLVELDDRFIKELSRLQRLHQSYTALPAAHRALAAGVTESRSGLADTGAFQEYGRGLHRTFAELHYDRKPE